MRPCLLRNLLFGAAAAIPTLGASVDVPSGLVGAHELPVFVRERIELTPGTSDEREPPADPRPKPPRGGSVPAARLLEISRDFVASTRPVPREAVLLARSGAGDRVAPPLAAAAPR